MFLRMGVSGWCSFDVGHARKCLRGGHVLSAEHQLAEFKSDSRVVDGGGYHG